MTVSEFAILADAIKTYYPKENMLPTKEAIALWYDALKDIDYKSAERGLKRYVMLNKFPPAISDIRENALGGAEIDELSEMEAWARISKAIGNANYHADEEFSKLPVDLQKVVGSPANLREWAMLDSDTVHSVVQSNVIRMYRTIAKRLGEEKRMPEPMRVKISVDTNLPAIESKQEPEMEPEVSGGYTDEMKEMFEETMKQIRNF